MHRVETIPAILENSLQDIALCLQSIRGAARAVQLDVVDGVYAPNRTWPYAEKHQREEFGRIAVQDDGLPDWEDFDFEIDLMVSRPERVVLEWVAAGASRLIIHAHSDGAREALQTLGAARGGEAGIAVGIALSSADTPDMLSPFDGLYDFVQVMGIEKVGFQGQNFDPRSLLLLRALKEKYPALPLQIDGGAGREHLRECAQAGASRIIEGSTIFAEDEDPKQVLKELQDILNV